MRPVLLAGACTLLCVLGCKPSPADYCRRTAQVTCDKLYECAPASASALGYANVADCRTQLELKQKCTAYEKFDCTGTDWSSYDKCLDDAAAQACTVTSAPASCTSATSTSTCVDTDKTTVRCTKNTLAKGGSNCTFTTAECADGHTYGVSCTGTDCHCVFDGTTGKGFTSSTDFCDESDVSKPAANAECGWNLR